MGPLALSSLRLQDPDRERPFRLPVAGVLSPAAFVVANFVVYWSSWPTVWRLMVGLAIGFLVFVGYRMFGDRDRQPRLDLRSASWLPPYLIGTAVISYLGRYDGRNLIPFWWVLGVVAVFSLAIFAFAVAVRLRPEDVDRYVECLEPVDDVDADEPLARAS